MIEEERSQENGNTKKQTISNLVAKLDIITSYAAVTVSSSLNSQLSTLKKSRCQHQQFLKSVQTRFLAARLAAKIRLKPVNHMLNLKDSINFRVFKWTLIH